MSSPGALDLVRRGEMQELQVWQRTVSEALTDEPRGLGLYVYHAWDLGLIRHGILSGKKGGVTLGPPEGAESVLLTLLCSGCEPGLPPSGSCQAQVDGRMESSRRRHCGSTEQTRKTRKLK